MDKQAIDDNIFSQSELLKGAPESQAPEILSAGRRKTLQEDEILFNQGDSAGKCYFLLSGLVPSFFHQRISFLAVTDAQYKDFIVCHPEHDAIISDPEFPVVFKRLAQGFAVFLGGCQEAGFYCPFDPLPDITV